MSLAATCLLVCYMMQDQDEGKHKNFVFYQKIATLYGIFILIIILTAHGGVIQSTSAEEFIPEQFIKEHSVTLISHTKDVFLILIYDDE